MNSQVSTIVGGEIVRGTVIDVSSRPIVTAEMGKWVMECLGLCILVG